MPAEPVAQPCEVCGVETTQRCSACVKAGIDLFFCSKDHQKLVWPAHKTVCGPGKAHPFAVTPLSGDELAWSLRNLDALDSTTESSLREDLNEMCRHDMTAETLLQELVPASYHESRLSHKHHFLAWVRHIAARRRGLQGVSAMLARQRTGGVNYHESTMSALSCAEKTISVSAVLGEAGLSLVQENATWYSLFQHKALLVSRLSQLVFASVENVPVDIARLREGADARFISWAQAGAGSNDPEVVRALASYDRSSSQDA
ncbi:hypothetical protein JCM9279_005885 [Rhodotorula babjevae]